MFTGLVECLAEVRNVERRAGILFIEIENPFTVPLEIGSSIAVQGACLTVVKSDEKSFAVEVGEETRGRTTLSNLRRGRPVNLERALKASGRFEGHFLLGHIDTVGKVSRILRKTGSWLLTVKYPAEYGKLVVEKGSVGVDGVSLTIARRTNSSFTVSLIPHTLTKTTLGRLSVSDRVNLEFDILLKAITGFERGENGRRKSLACLY